MSRRLEVVRTFLELSTPGQLRAARIEDDPLLRLARVPVPSMPLVQRLYREVGEAYHWVDRWAWSPRRWREWVSQPGYGVWILSYDGDLAGFFELLNQPDGSVEIVLFGLVPRYHGRGLGKHLLTVAVEVSWSIGANRVWLHTCTLDHPAALPNYLARGFVPVRTEMYETEVES